MKTQLIEKKANFPVKKRFGRIFSRIIEHDKCQVSIYKDPEGNLGTIVQAV